MSTRLSHGSLVSLVILGVLLAGCTPRGDTRTLPSAGPSQVSESAHPKRITLATAGDAKLLYQKLNLRNAAPGVAELEQMVSSGLTYPDPSGVARAQLAEAVPTIENGLWKVFPDGRMETTWRIRPGAVWHDGAAFTPEDLKFTANVVRDRAIPNFSQIGLDLIETIDALDARTVVVQWKSTFIDADKLFSYELAVPLPRHLLEAPYSDDKAGFLDLPYWSEDFVGTGAFRLREFERGSHLRLGANEQYVLGRPKLDEIIVKFIPDANVLTAAILAGAVDMTLGRSISPELAARIGAQWREGRIEVSFTSNANAMFPQFINPNPPALADVRLRRALLHAIDRAFLVESLAQGMSSVAHVYLKPGQPIYAQAETSVPRYEYDPRRAIQLIEEVGYVRGPADEWRDGSGQRLTLEIRSTPDDTDQKLMQATADYWRRIGAAVETLPVPPQRLSDIEWRATFPAFDLKSPPLDKPGLKKYHSSQVPLPENRFQVTSNTARYINPDLDAQIDRYFVTVPMDERVAVMGEIVNHIAERVTWMGFFYQSDAMLVPHRIANVNPRDGLENSYLWELR